MSDPTSPRAQVAVAALLAGFIGVGVGVLISQPPKEEPVLPRLATVESQVELLNGELEEIKKANGRRATEELAKTSIGLNVSGDSYTPMTTPFGPILVRVENVEPYADGYRLTLELGNPMSVSFHGFQGYFSYRGYSGSNQQSFTTVLRGGRWNPVRVVLSKLAKEDLEGIRFSMDLNEVSLIK